MTDKSQLERPRTGLNALKARVKLRGLAGIDRRTSGGSALVRWRRELVAALGGEPAVSPQRMALLEVAVRTRLLVEHIDAHILALGSLVGRRGRLKPIVEQRDRLAARLEAQLGALGLDRIETRNPHLERALERGRIEREERERRERAR